MKGQIHRAIHMKMPVYCSVSIFFHKHLVLFMVILDLTWMKVQRTEKSPVAKVMFNIFCIILCFIFQIFREK